jgi:hypothetical protein
MPKSVFNPGNTPVVLTINGVAVSVGPMQAVTLDDEIGNALQDLLPGLEYNDVDAFGGVPEPAPEVKPAPKKPKAKPHAKAKR